MFENPSHTAMTAALPLVLAVIVVFSFTACAQEVAYAYGDSGGRPLESGNITVYNGTDMVTFAVATSPQDESPSYVTSRSMQSIKEEISRKIDKGNDQVRDQGLTLIGNISGPRRIDQFCAIYDLI